MCGVCAKYGINIHVTADFEADPQDFSLDPFAGGTYKRTATSPVKTIATLTQVIDQIDSGRAQDVSDGVITYAFFDHKHALGLNNNPGFGEGTGYSTFSEAQKDAARLAFGQWDDLIAPSFVEVGAGPGASNWAKKGAVDIWLANTTTGPGQAWAYFPGYGNQYTRVAGDTWVASPEANWSNQWFNPGGYGNTTLIHELGHSIGLSHPGAYNGAAATTYDGMAEYAQDSMQYSIMSYWGGGSTGALTVNWSLFLNNYAQTPMVHDILTVQSKYGADPTTRTGNDTYGFGNTTGKSIYDFAQNPYPYMSIYDAGGNDTIDASGYTASQFINLKAGSFSSVGAAVPTAAQINANMAAFNAAMSVSPDYVPFGDVTQVTVTVTATSFMNAAAARIQSYTGVSGIAATSHDNFSIAYGVTIENAIGGSARDLLWGNEVANTLDGRGGNDVIDGFQGADTYIGGTGDDSFVFRFLETGDRIMDFAAGDKIDVSKIDAISSTAGTNDAFTFIGAGAFSGAAGELRYDASGVVQGDVNGDGLADFSVIIANNAALTVTDFLL